MAQKHGRGDTPRRKLVDFTNRKSIPTLNFGREFSRRRDKSSERTITGAVLITSFLGSRNLVVGSPIVSYRLPAFEGTF